MGARVVSGYLGYKTPSVVRGPLSRPQRDVGAYEACWVPRRLISRGLGSSLERHKAKFGEAPVSLHIQVLREAGEAKSGGNALLFKASVFKRSIMRLTIHVHLLVILPPIIFSSLSPSLPNPFFPVSLPSIFMSLVL